MLFGSILFLSQTKVSHAVKRVKDGRGGEWLCLAECGIAWLAAEQGQAEVVGRFHRARFLLCGLVGILMEKTHFLVHESDVGATVRHSKSHNKILC